MHLTTALVAAKRSLLLAGALAGLAVGGSAFAANTTFTAAGSALWTTAGNWSGGLPTASDVAVFGTGANSIVRVTGTTLAVAGLVFNNSNAVQLTGTTANAFLNVGAQGIIVESGAGIVTLGTNTNNFRLGIRLTASHTWENRKAASAGETLFRSQGGGAGIELQSFTLTFDGSGYTNIQGPVTGSGGMVKNGSGAVNFSTDNPVFTGGVVLNSGLLQLNASSVGTTSGPLGNPVSSVLTVNGGTMTARGTAGATRTVSNNMVWGGNFTVGPPPTVALVNLALTGSTTLSGTNTTRTVTVGNSDGAPVFSVGPIGDGGNNVGLTKSGTGLLVFLGDNTYTGLTTVSSGTLQVGSILAGGTAGSIAGDILLNGAATRLVIERSTGATLGGDISGSGSIVKNGAGSLSLTGSNSYSGSLTVNEGVLGIGSVDALPGWDTTGRYTISGSAGITFGNAVTEGQIATILSGTAGTVSPDAVSGLDTSAGDRTFTGDLAAAFPGRNIVKTGANALVLTGNSTLTGGKSVSVFSGGSLQIGDGGTTGSIVGAVANSGTLTFNRSDDITFAGSISGAGDLAKAGSGRLTLATANPSFTGATRIAAGTIRVSDGGALGSGTIITGPAADTGALELTGGVTMANPLSINGRTTAVTSVRNVSGTNTLSGNVTLFAQGGGYEFQSEEGLLRLTGTWARGGSTANASTRNMRLSGAGDFEIAGPLPVGGQLGTGIEFTKSGGGTVFFSGTRSLPGNTAVDGGRLFLNPGSLFSDRTSTVTIAAGATLAGSGTIENVVQITGIHAPGASPGLQTFTNNLNYNAQSSLVWELAGNTEAAADRGTLYDGVDVSGAGGALSINTNATLSLVFDAPGSTVAWSNAFWAADREWKVINAASPATWNGSLFGTILTSNDSEDVALATARPDASFALDARVGDGLYLTYTAVPEPSTLAMLAGVAFSCLAARRLRRVARAD
jgi:autotransporter-associated beta strand protein